MSDPAAEAKAFMDCPDVRAWCKMVSEELDLSQPAAGLSFTLPALDDGDRYFISWTCGQCRQRIERRLKNGDTHEGLLQEHLAECGR